MVALFKFAFWFPPGSIFAPLGISLVSFWILEGALGLPGTDLATELDFFCDFSRKLPIHFEVNFGSQQL